MNSPVCVVLGVIWLTVGAMLVWSGARKKPTPIPEGSFGVMIEMSNGASYDVAFEDCNSLIDVREWLSGEGKGLHPFINLGDHNIIRLDNITNIVPRPKN